MGGSAHRRPCVTFLEPVQKRKNCSLQKYLKICRCEKYACEKKIYVPKLFAHVNVYFGLKADSRNIHHRLQVE